MDRRTHEGGPSWAPALLLALACACATNGAPLVQSDAEPAAAPSAEASPRGDEARLVADVTWLADDARQGRRAGTPEGLLAGEWLAERMESIGLEPVGEGRGSWLQEFEVPMPARDAGGSRLEASLVDGTSVEMSAPDLAPLFCAEGGEVEGPLVFAGYGIVHEEREWDDFADLDVEGAVVLIVRGTPPAPVEPEEPDSETEAGAEAGAEESPHGAAVTPGDGWGGAGSLFHKVMTAKRNGAIGVIVAQHPDQAGEPPLPFDTGRTAEAGIPAAMVSSGAAGRLLPGYADAVAGIDAGGGSSAGTGSGTVLLVADVRRESGPAVNVLGRLPGLRRDRTVVVGAHYDHLGLGGTGSLAPDELGQVHNGADDNASGTAAVLEIARLLAEGPTPAGDVVFALWSGEEIGLLGSEHWGRNPTVPLEDVVANLNLDMVGRAGDGVLQVLGAGTAEPFAAWLEDAGPASDLELQVSLSGAGMGGSDHQTFIKREIPALHLFSGVHTDYHKPTDDVERFEAGGAARVVTLSVEVVRRMQTADVLAFVEPEVDTQQAQPTTRWRVWFGTVPEYSSDAVGLELAGTSAGSPAEKAGFLRGDVILQVGDIEVENIYDFMYSLQVYKPGDVVLTRFLRDGEEQSVHVTLATRALE